MYMKHRLKYLSAADSNGIGAPWADTDPHGRKRRHIGEEGGFTLVETLVSMMILAISLAVLLQLFSGGLNSSRLADAYTRAIFHAREKMEEVLISNRLAEGTTEGDFGDGYKWQVRIAMRVPPEDEIPKLPIDTFEISIVIGWLEGNREKQFELNTRKIAEPASSSG